MSTAVGVRLVAAPPPIPAEVQDGPLVPPPRAVADVADDGPPGGAAAAVDGAGTGEPSADEAVPGPGGPPLEATGTSPGAAAARPGVRASPRAAPRAATRAVTSAATRAAPPATIRAAPPAAIRAAPRAAARSRPPAVTWTATRAAPAGPRRSSAPRRSGDVAGGAPELDPRQACCMVALAAVEVLAGNRPLAQLARWLTPEVYDGLARRAVLTAPGTRVLDAAAGARDLAADPTDPVPAGAARRPSVRRVRVHRVDEHTVEASVVVAHADRVRAVAVRLTRSTGRWRAAALVVG